MPNTAAPQPAILPNWRSTARLRGGHRSLTMLRPVCRPCEKEYERAKGWWRNCTHDPYITMVPVPTSEQEWVDEIVNGEPTGRKVKVEGSVKEYMAYEVRPNVVHVSISPRVNGAFGLANARYKGFIRPSELRSPHFPNGIAETCEFHGCKQQVGLVEYKSGRYCRRDEAAICYFEGTDSQVALEVGTGRPQSDARRREQLDGAPV